MDFLSTSKIFLKIFIQKRLIHRICIHTALLIEFCRGSLLYETVGNAQSGEGAIEAVGGDEFGHHAVEAAFYGAVLERDDMPAAAARILVPARSTALTPFMPIAPIDKSATPLPSCSLTAVPGSI